jgi:hypothetical protein
MTFRVGQKVACIRNDWNSDDPPGWAPPTLNRALPQVGEVFTICGLREDGFLNLEEMWIVGRDAGDTISFDWAAFRPLIEKKTDISVFTKILDDVSKRRELQVVQ